MFNSFLEFMQECMEKRIDDLRLVIAADEGHKRVTKEHGELF
jgi:GTPase